MPAEPSEGVAAEWVVRAADALGMAGEQRQKLIDDAMEGILFVSITYRVLQLSTLI